MKSKQSLVDDLLVRYLRGPDHPFKLRFVGWLLDSLFRRVVATTDSGVMVLTSKDRIQRALICYGHFEPGTAALHRSLLKPGDVYVDLGANAGAFTLLAAGAVSGAGKVIAVEPNPSVFSRLLENLALNDFTHNVRPFLCAVSDQEDWAYLTPPPRENSGLARLTSHLASGAFVIPTVRLSRLLAFAEATQIKLMKIDVEGGEHRILHELFTAGIKPRHFIIEYLPVEFPLHAEVPELLVSQGYTLLTIRGERPQLELLEENNLWARLKTQQ